MSGSAKASKLYIDEASIQSPELGLDTPILYIMRQSKRLVKIALPPQLVVHFVDCIEEVGDNYGDKDAPPVLDISRRAWLRLWITNSGDGGIVDSLDPARYKLWDLLAWTYAKMVCSEVVRACTFGRNVHPMKGRSALLIMSRFACYLLLKR